MSSNSIKDYLKNNIPEFQQGESALSAFLEASGQFLDEIKEAIEQGSYSHNWDKGTMFNVENSTLDRGIRLPIGTGSDNKRKFLRDISEIILKNGTRDSMEHALKMIGLDATVHQAWLQNPKELEQGIVKDIKTGQISDANVGNFFFLDFVYGDEYVAADGATVFKGRPYTEINLDEDTISGIPIVGEVYKEVPKTFDTVSKTPYVAVVVESGDFTSHVGEYFSEETGKWYAYSQSEELELLGELVKYFLEDKRRPTTVRYLIIISSQNIDETIDILEEFEQTGYAEPLIEEFSDDIIIHERLCKSGSMYVGTDIGVGNFFIGKQTPVSLEIGLSKRPRVGELGDEFINTEVGESVHRIGAQSPLLVPYSIVGTPHIGAGSKVTLLEETNWEEVNSSRRVYSNKKFTTIVLRPYTNIEFTNIGINSDVAISVYSYDGTVEESSVVSDGEFYEYFGREETSIAYIEVVDMGQVDDGFFDIDVTYTEFDQEPSCERDKSLFVSEHLELSEEFTQPDHFQIDESIMETIRLADDFSEFDGEKMYLVLNDEHRIEESLCKAGEVDYSGLGIGEATMDIGQESQSDHQLSVITAPNIGEETATEITKWSEHTITRVLYVEKGLHNIRIRPMVEISFTNTTQEIDLEFVVSNTGDGELSRSTVSVGDSFTYTTVLEDEFISIVPVTENESNEQVYVTFNYAEFDQEPDC